MKRLFLAFLLIASPVCAADFLVCDIPVDTIISCDVEVTRAGETAVTNVIPAISGADLMLLDVSTFQPGPYVFRARFVGSGGWASDWSEPLSTVKPGKPGKLRVK